MTRRIHTAGRDHWSSHGQMSEQRRQQVHGRLVTLAEQAREAGEPPIWLGTALILAVGIVGAACLFAWFGGAS